MPALCQTAGSTRPKVLVTGANGFIGQWVLKTVLDRGYNALVVVRSEAKAKGLKDFLLPIYQAQLAFAYIHDFTKEGAFDEAVVGVDAITHVATSLPSANEDPNETIRFGAAATLSVLNSALKYGDEMKRIVITSTIGTVWTDQLDPRTFPEEDWNEHTMPDYEAGHRDPETAYFSSKIFAERAVWKFIQDNKGLVPWDVTVLNPPFVYGPNLLPVSTLGELTSSALLWMTSIVTGTDSPLPSSLDHGWIDVRDVGEAHVRCLEREEASNERIVPCAGSYLWREWFDVVREVAPSVLPADKATQLLSRFPSPIVGEVQHKVKFDTSKAQRILGMVSYRKREEMVRDMLDKAMSEGWLCTSSSLDDALQSRVKGSIQMGR